MPGKRPEENRVWFRANRRLPYGIRTRVFLSLALLAVLLCAALALAIEGEVRRTLERELDLRLEAVGETAITLIGPGFVPALLALTPAHQEFRLYQDRRSALSDLRSRTGVRRIFLADPAGRSFVDTDVRVAIATPLPQLRSDRPEMSRILAGESAAAPLYTDEGGEPRKTAYVPVVSAGRTLALVGVEADATFLAAVRRLRRRLLEAAFLGVALSFGFAAVVARGLTRPLDGLVSWAQSVGGGNLSTPAPRTAPGEIGFLARTLEQMRVDIEARDREQRAMVAGVAHEIRNPLGGIRLYADLLAGDAALSETARARLEKIRRELDHLGSIVEQFLLYARPAEPVPQCLSVSILAEELRDWLEPDGAAREVRLMLEGRPDATIQVDPTHVRQILHNLLRNAFEASPKGSRVRFAWTEQAGAIRLEVEDEGPGVSSLSRERLFEPFFTTKVHGSGLGLAIVQRLVLLNRGRIELSTGELGGACFAVTLPRGVA